MVDGFTDLNDRASHPCGVLHGSPFSVFAKLTPRRQARVELAGLTRLTRLSGVATPTPVASSIVDTDGGALLLFEAAPERAPADREPSDWAAIGRALATLHRVTDAHFGLDADGFFGPLPQDNRPVPSNRWTDFYRERRLLPLLRSAVDMGHAGRTGPRRAAPRRPAA